MFTSRESGAMAQRGEIQCAERQFALQSGRQEKRRKFQQDDTCGGSVKRLPLFVFPVRQSYGLSWDAKRGFFISSIRV